MSQEDLDPDDRQLREGGRKPPPGFLQTLVYVILGIVGAIVAIVILAVVVLYVVCSTMR